MQFDKFSCKENIIVLAHKHNEHYHILGISTRQHYIPKYRNLLMSPRQSNCTNVTKVIQFATVNYNIKSVFISLFTLEHGLKSVENYNHPDKCILK